MPIYKGLTKISGAGGGDANLSNATGVLDVEHGGTGAIDAETARENLGIKDYDEDIATIKQKLSTLVFDWGDENAVGDAAWWVGLQKHIATLDEAGRLALIGKKKKVSLSSPVLGANAASMICIGSDIDADCTLTFQTEGTLPDDTVFGSDALWDGSDAQSLCNDFANYCSAKDSIKSITKLNISADIADIQTTAKCWIPSECEMGFTSSDRYSYVTRRNEWTLGGKTQAYQYYTDDYNRLKYKMSSNGNLTTNTVMYWERSRHFDDPEYISAVAETGVAAITTPLVPFGLAPAFTIQGSVSSTPKILTSSSAPTSSDGNDGDIWIQYTL